VETVVSCRSSGASGKLYLSQKNIIITSESTCIITGGMRRVVSLPLVFVLVLAEVLYEGRRAITAVAWGGPGSTTLAWANAEGVFVFDYEREEVGRPLCGIR
jgi:hypothetical protein